IQGTLPTAIGLPLYYVAKVALSPEESGRRYEYRVDYAGPDGTIIESVPQAVDAVQPAAPGRGTKINIVLVMNGLTFPTAGEYTFRLSISGEEITRTYLYV